jgi:mRNA-degrading endonuclease toxin of MazEF toxin-antitoxin module
LAVPEQISVYFGSLKFDICEEMKKNMEQLVFDAKDLEKLNTTEKSFVEKYFIVSNDENNKYAPTVQVIPLSSKVNKVLPVHVAIGMENGIEKPSIALPEQETTIDKIDLVSKVGKCIDQTMLLLERAIALQKGFTIPFDIFRVKMLVKKLIEKYDMCDIDRCDKNHPIALDELIYYCKLYNKDYHLVFNRYKQLFSQNQTNIVYCKDNKIREIYA